jgi:hypothetical protein
VSEAADNSPAGESRVQPFSYTAGVSDANCADTPTHRRRTTNTAAPTAIGEFHRSLKYIEPPACAWGVMTSNSATQL